MMKNVNECIMTQGWHKGMEWRNNNITVERVHSYSLYRPMILY